MFGIVGDSHGDGNGNGDGGDHGSGSSSSSVVTATAHHVFGVVYACDNLDLNKRL